MSASPPSALPSLRARLARHLESGDYEAAWALLEEHSGRLTVERDFALAWLELLGASPDRPQLLEQTGAVLQTWPHDPQLVSAACAALLASAQRRPPDEPPLADGPAHLAAEAARRCLDALGDGHRRDPTERGYLWINLANALRLSRQDDEQALQAYGRALELDPDKGWWWFDRSLFHKGRGQWQQALDCMLRARARLGERKSVLWNIAICATALGDGDVAAGMWQKLGLQAQRSERSGMPWVDGLPPVQLRVPSREDGTGPGAGPVPERATLFELVWVAPLSPCHGVVQTPTFRHAPVDYGDVVLWDAVPVGMVEHGGQRVPRFALLARLRQGDEHRWRFAALQHEPGELQRLEQSLPDGTVVHVHDEQVEWLCALCASGESMRKHDHGEPEPHRVAYGKVVVPARVPLPAFRDALEQALKRRGTVALALPGLYEELGDTKKAGQQHQAWRGIERSADKRRAAESGAVRGVQDPRGARGAPGVQETRSAHDPDSAAGSTPNGSQ